MQCQLPMFPSDTKLINSTLGFRSQDDFVYYLHNGNPIYCHRHDDRNSYHFILGNLVCNQLCTIGELHESLGEARKNIERYTKAFREKGASHFFSRKETRGQCSKVTSDLLQELQSCLDSGWSAYRIGKHYCISDSAIRYHLNHGKLKKKET